MNYDARENLKAYLDGELDPELAEQVRTALEVDAELKKEAEFMRSLSRSFSSLRPRAEATREMAEQAAARLVRPHRSILRAPWVWAGACGLLLIAVFARPLFESAQHELSGQDAAKEMKQDSVREGAPAAGSVEESQAEAPTSAPSAAQSEALIQESSITVRTASIDTTLREIDSIANSLDGSIEVDPGSIATGPNATDKTILLRVAPYRFDAARKQLLSIRGSTEASVQYRNVAEEIHRLENETYRERSSQQIDSFQGQLSRLRDLAERSTIRIRIILEP
ncbi:MAG: hypothetical protein KIT74_10595 [Fimbriimonadales bacterium]|nr:hypothetical protein [Fimbriimonadales bacterium]